MNIQMADKIRGLRTLILSLSGLLVYVVIFLITKGIDPVNLGIGLSILLAPGFGANAVKSVWQSKNRSNE